VNFVRALLVALVLALLPGAVTAAEPLREFDSAAERERYRSLLEKLRCLVCQNESLASSNADLAQDLRDEVYRLVVVEDRSNAAAVDFLVQRYGDFVLFRPPVQPNTWLLWFGPLVLLAIGATAAAAVVRQRRAARQAPLSAAEHAKAQRLLADDDDPGGSS
jgi:cytochrome c-type biogenesis protein CcmH